MLLALDPALVILKSMTTTWLCMSSTCSQQLNQISLLSGISKVVELSADFRLRDLMSTKSGISISIPLLRY